jgi:chemotaxis protein methyltransferase CheR
VQGGGLERIVVAWATGRLGFDVRSLRLDRLMAAAAAQADRLGGAQALQNALHLGSDPEAENALVAAATVGETYFFRQHEHFDLLAEMKEPRGGTFKAWSAGCSSGEEAYSLAGILRQRLGLEAPALEVWGTDINPQSLALARRAEYSRWSWRQGEDTALEARRALALHPLTRACVHFAQHNLLDPPRFDPAGGSGERFDLIFCRNVLVYFSPRNAERAVSQLRSALKTGAWLVLGNMDLSGQPRGFRRVGPAALCVYEKTADAVPEALREPALAAASSAVPEAAPARAPLPLEPLDPVEWHRAILAEIETGHGPGALLELQTLVEEKPDYLPGLFEHALGLRRVGKPEAAAAVLRGLLKAADGRDPREIINGPEPLSLEFYVNSARSFLDSLGGRF